MKLLWFLVLLLALFLAVSQDINVQIELDYNPCDFKTCNKGESCRIVVQRKLLEMPIAVCVQSDKPQKDDASCTMVSEGTNILSCKTESEWNDVGSNLCTAKRKFLRSTKVTHICHDTVTKRYLQAEFTCCSQASVVTPPVMTNAPPDVTTMPTQRNDGGDASDDDASTLIATGADQISTTEDTNKSPLKNEDKKTSYLAIIIGFAAVILFVVIALYLVYRRQKKIMINRKQAKSHEQTVIINPYCDDYKLIFNEEQRQVMYPDLSTYTQAPSKF